MSQKFENLLNLALETPEAVRERTEDLNIGFDTESRSWELIVKYNGNLDGLAAVGITVEYLIAGYAILTVPEQLVELLGELPEIEYVEKPKRYFYTQVRPTDNSCVAPITLREPFLTGENVLLAVLDSGIEYVLPDFRDSDGNTRIRFLWDQSLTPEPPRRMPPEGFSVGVEFDSEMINAALNAPSSVERHEMVPSRDVTGHGTAVAGIAAASVGGRYEGVAPQAQLLVVKLGQPDPLSFPRTTEIMRGVTYALQKARLLGMPLVINLSFGNSYGAHNGSSLLERFLDNAAEIGRTVICVGSGNEGSAGGHFQGNIRDIREVELAVAQYERKMNVQFWKNYSDSFRLRLRSPGGQEAELNERIERGKYTLRLEQTEILVYFGEPLPYSVEQEIYFEFLPVGGNYINSGVWSFILEQVRVVTGQYYMYLPSGAVQNEGTGFYRPTPQVTLTIPSTASKVITIGAYDSVFDAYADFSGRGYESEERTIGVVTAGIIKPDIVAPGVAVLAPDVYGGYTPVTGTSFATPIASGGVALLMEWGIVRGNDPFLYGEKVKAYLRKGARPLRGETEYPNARVGWGALCVSSSLPE
ncbi:MAG: S8 family serine peptidase [Roseburia sp.]|nr:S8 family serine peptidase [Roseburia sp.]